MMPILAVLSSFTVSAHAQDGSKSMDAKYLFTVGLTPACGLCHTLAAAGTSGQIGPNLDDLQPTAERVALAVKLGSGVMPPFDGKLDEEQIAAIAQFVAKATGGAK
jgi:cytochrome c6